MAKLPDRVAEAMYEGASRWRKDSGVRSYLGMSGIGGLCRRKIWYGFRGYTPSAIEGRIQMIFSLGDAVELQVLKWLEQAGYKVRDRQLAFEDMGGLFRGHCDGIVEGVTQKPHILEIKSASASRFKAFQESGIAAISPEYAGQVQCYMGYSGLERAIFVVMNKNTCEIYTERVHFSRSSFVELKEKATSIIGKDVEIRGFDQDSPECGMCPYKGHCWSAPYIQETPTCGTCVHCIFPFDTIEPYCGKHAHHILKWGKSCPDWSFTDTALDVVPF